MVPDFLAAQGFDAATLALQALKRAQSQQVTFSSALRGIDAYDGLTGRVYIGSDGELRRSFAVLQLSGEDVIELNAPDTVATQGVEQPLSETGAHVAPVIAPPPPEGTHAH